jgi:hypothetical protein
LTHPDVGAKPECPGSIDDRAIHNQQVVGLVGAPGGSRWKENAGWQRQSCDRGISKKPAT